MAIPLKYNIGNLMSRKVSTLMTIAGIGIVIAVMVAMLALYTGVQEALVSSGSPENMMVLREGAQAESTSWVTREKYRIIRSLEGIARGSGGEALVSPELYLPLGVYDNIFYHSIHGRPLASSLMKTGSHVSGHFDPILVLLSPVYLLKSSAESLLSLQSFWMAAGVFPAYLLGAELLRSRFAGVVVAVRYGPRSPSRMTGC